jgi:LysR family glycine cleavage system transcriptional activator
MDRPSLNGLRAFEVVARLGSFTRAAEELYVTQGAVSHQVRRLERQLGVSLFTRQGRLVELTPEGARLSLAASEAFERLDAAVDALTRRPPDSVLVVSVPPSFATRFLVPRLERFHALRPDLDVRISAAVGPVDPIRDGIDVCVRFAKAGKRGGLAATLLVAEDVFPVCNPRLTSGRDALRRPEDLARHTLLHVDPGAPDPDLPDWRKWLRAARVKGVSTRGGDRFSHAGLALSAALAGQGVALGRTTLVADDLAAGRLCRPFAASFRSRFAYWLQTPATDSAREKTRPFREWLQDEVAACLAVGPS